MINEFEKTFSTGQFAKLLEVNKDTLLYYDKINLFKPAGTHANGYRYYTLEQYDQFIAIQSLREAEVSIKELQHYFESPNIENLKHLAIVQQQKVALEIKKLQEIQFFLERTVDLTEEMARVPFDEVIIKELPKEAVVYSENKVDWTAPMEELFEHSTHFLKQLGVKSTAAHGAVYDKEAFLNGELNDYSYLFCRIDEPTSVMKPAGHYAILYHRGCYEEIEEAYTILRSSLNNQNVTIDGNIYEEYLLHSIATNEESKQITKISVKVIMP